jgi:transposase
LAGWPAFEHILELYRRADWRAPTIGGSAKCPARFRQTLRVTLDVKSRVWITGCGHRRYPRPKNSSVHSLGTTLSQAGSNWRTNPEVYPQWRPQTAHRTRGVSAHPVHRPVHTMVRRFARHAEDCRRRSIACRCT